MSNPAMKYTQEQLDIDLLKNTNEGILRTLSRIETEIKSHFHWTMGLILGLYTIGNVLPNGLKKTIPNEVNL